VLLVVAHPGIGAALETLLRIEDRYEVRRAQSLDQVAAVLDGWPADLALVDGLLTQNGRTEALAMPAIVLTGNLGDGKRLSARLPEGRGWLRKDATAGELHATIDEAINRSGPRVTPLLVAGLAASAAGLIALAWLLFGTRV
jgi:DNA-binding NarL/FixJ family response regulator